MGFPEYHRPRLETKLSRGALKLSAIAMSFRCRAADITSYSRATEKVANTGTHVEHGVPKPDFNETQIKPPPPPDFWEPKKQHEPFCGSHTVIVLRYIRARDAEPHSGLKKQWSCNFWCWELYRACKYVKQKIRPGYRPNKVPWLAWVLPESENGIFDLVFVGLQDKYHVLRDQIFGQLSILVCLNTIVDTFNHEAQTGGIRLSVWWYLGLKIEHTTNPKERWLVCNWSFVRGLDRN